MVQDFVKVADNFHDVNVVAINMSKSDGEALEIDGFPTIRMYKGKKGMKDFNGESRDYQGFVQFLK